MIKHFLNVTMLVPLIAVINALQVIAPGFSPDTQDVPIDGGICLLIAAGIGYGIKKTNTKTNASKKTNHLD